MITPVSRVDGQPVFQRHGQYFENKCIGVIPKRTNGELLKL